jgi:hypothetical protein
MSTIKVGTLLAADGTTTTQPSIPALDKRMAKAWVNFNGETTTTNTIRASYNVSSVTDHGGSEHTVNFATALADANYCISGLVQQASNFSNWGYSVNPKGATPTTSAVRVKVANATGTAIDCYWITLTITGN